MIYLILPYENRFVNGNIQQELYQKMGKNTSTVPQTMPYKTELQPIIFIIGTETRGGVASVDKTPCVYSAVVGVVGSGARENRTVQGVEKSSRNQTVAVPFLLIACKSTVCAVSSMRQTEGSSLAYRVRKSSKVW